MYQRFVVEFVPLGWTEDKLAALLPSVTEITHTTSEIKSLEISITEKDAVLQRMQDLKVEIRRYLNEFEEFGSRSGTLFPIDEFYLTC